MKGSRTTVTITSDCPVCEHAPARRQACVRINPVCACVEPQTFWRELHFLIDWFDSSSDFFARLIFRTTYFRTTMKDLEPAAGVDLVALL